MSKSHRQLLLEWSEQSTIDRQQLQQALTLSDVLPSKHDWRGFLDKFLLYVGILLVISGVVFFFAYNWDALGRFTKFAIVQGTILIALFAFWRLGLERLTGKLALMFAAMLVGVLLALIGQTYQTGADTYELFMAWCVLILPWAILAKFDVLWSFWLLLLNLSITLYYQVFGNLFHVIFGGEQVLWVLFVVNTLALIVWECVARKGSERRKIRWMTRLLAIVSGGLVTTLAILNVLSFELSMLLFAGLIAWCVWMLSAYYWYRHIELDVYVLTIGVLSVVAVVSVFLGRLLFSNISDLLSLLLMSAVVIGLSAAGAYWIRNVIARDKS